MLRAVLKARDLVGSFDKPKYINFTADLCAHSRSKLTGCHRCLDLCPTGAITPDGDHVRISAEICAGCGQCAAACPTGAASYALPPADTLLHKLRAMLLAYRPGRRRQADCAVPRRPTRHAADRCACPPWRRPSGQRAAACGQRGDAGRSGSDRGGIRLWRGGRAISAARKAAARHRRTFADHCDGRCHSFRTGIFGTAALPRSRPTIRMRSARRLRGIETGAAVERPSTFKTVGKRRDLLRFALTELHRVAPAPADVIALPEGAPIGAISVDVSGCTLCLSCVSACPTGALLDDPERPALKFVEDACVQCGLCKSTCPEKVITLKPQIDFTAASAPARGSSRRKSRRFASAATSRSASKARSTRLPPNSRAGTGCIPAATNAPTRSGCARTAASSP